MLQRETYYLDLIQEKMIIPFPIDSWRLYYIDIKVILSEKRRADNFQMEGVVEILDRGSKTGPILIKQHKFFNSLFFDVQYGKPSSKDPDFTFSYIELEFPNIKESLFVSLTIDSLHMRSIQDLKVFSLWNH